MLHSAAPGGGKAAALGLSRAFHTRSDSGEGTAEAQAWPQQRPSQAGLSLTSQKPKHGGANFVLSTPCTSNIGAKNAVDRGGMSSQACVFLSPHDAAQESVPSVGLV